MAWTIAAYYILPQQGRVIYARSKTKEETRRQETESTEESKAGTAECEGQAFPVSV